MTEYRTAILSRMFIVLGLLFLLPCALAFQLFRINYVEGEGLRELWNQQAIDYISIPAQRGNIYDQNGTLLATNATDYQIALDPKIKGLTRDQIVQLTKKMAEVTNQPSSYYLNKIDSAPSRSRYVVLGKNLSGIAKDEIKALGIRGVIVEENFRRKYTFGTLAAHSLGFVNHNMDGRTGIESFYNTELKGEDGVRQVRKDPFNRIFEYVGAPKKLPQDGYSLHTTIDAYIQAILEDELKTGVEKHQANYGTGIILDPKTGAIKALANYPTFDPNFPGNEDDINRRNFAVSDMVEPGSTFKLVTAIAAVEQRKVDFEEIFETPESGEIVIHGLTLRDHDPLGNMDFASVMRQSSNVATAEIAMRLDKDKFYQYARNMGFGTPTYVDIAGEESGRMAKPYEWSLVSLPWMSHGYELLSTPIQVAQAYAAFANDGLMMRPYVVERIEDKQGNIISEHHPVEIRRIAKKKTLDALLPVFESVVSDSGTGEFAQVEGLSIAGKTGTAKKVVNGRYTNNYRGSFVGFFPVEDPKYVCLILLDEPKPVGYGGYTAGPIFRQVATRIAGLDSDLQRDFRFDEHEPELLALTPYVEGLPVHQAEKILEELNLEFKSSGKDGFVLSQEPTAGTELMAGQEILLTLSETYAPIDSASIKEGLAEIPDLKGMSMRSASNLLTSLGLKSSMIGSGTIFAQFPKAGELMRKGSEVTIRGKARSLEIITEAGRDK
ncbi:MAG: PASTA domain-containing protein [Balneolaceae bacterium]|nr:PASTA domain-containing protein [Balneolaceae bacterium]MBO6545004.1 PASTA domain-containing protein [Balneolaceae bacterium]MBO6646400.1 PASTA domain-containing protein [Balneolaceae bacterium]